MTKGRKRYVWIPIIVVILIGVFCAGFFPVSHSSLKNKAEKILLKKTAADTCSVRKVTVTPYRGITISGIRCVKNLGAKKRLTIAIPAVKIPCHFFRVLSHRKALLEIFRPQRKSVRKKKLPRKSRQTLYAVYSRIFLTDTVLLSCARSIRLVNGTFSVDSAGQEIMRGEGITTTVKVKKSSPFVLKVTCSAKMVHAEKILLLNPYLAMTCKGPQWNITKVKGNVFDGKFTGNGDVNILQNRINNCRLEMKDVNLEKWYATQSDTVGSVSGMGSLTMILDSSGTTFPSLHGTGNFKLAKLAADEIPLANTLALLTELTCLSHLRFEEVTGDFVIRNGRIRSENIEGSGDPLSLSVSGTLQPEDASFDFDIQGIFEASYKDSVPAIVWNAMLPLKDDRRMFKCRVYGTPQKPSVSLDKKMARRAVRSVFKSIGDEIKGMFKKRK